MFQIDKQSRVPIYEQLVESIERNILCGLMIGEDKILSVRELSGVLSINPNTIQKAYTSLETRGITYSVSGVGRFVSNNAVDILKSETYEQELLFKNTVSSLKLMGVTKEKLEKIISEIYKGEN